MTTLKTIAQQWQDFEDKTIHPDAPAVQRQEMRNAFYAGFASSLGTHNQLASDSYSEDQAICSLSKFHTEAEAYFLKPRVH